MGTKLKRFGIARSYLGEQRTFGEQVDGQLASHAGRDRVLYDKTYTR